MDVEGAERSEGGTRADAISLSLPLYIHSDFVFFVFLLLIFDRDPDIEFWH